MRLSCSHCPDCPRDKNPVPGHGPLPCDVMFIGEAPGANEDRTGIPFAGLAGTELDYTYLRLAGRKRPTVRVSNTVRCRPENNKKPSAKLAASCAEHNLRAEIAACNPRIIVLMGATACSLDPTIDSSFEHGFPRKARFLGWSGTVVPMIHPASGLHDGNQMMPLIQDFTLLKSILDGTYKAPVDPYPVVDYSMCESVKHLKQYISAYSNHLNLTSLDTEGHGRRKFSIQISREPGTGIMIMADNKPVVDYLRHSFLGMGEFVMQFAEHDLDFLQELDFDTRNPNLVVWDTMRDAYNIGGMPQGLKKMVFRSIGIRMRTWEDVVLPHSKKALIEWLGRAVEYASNELYDTQDVITSRMSEIEKALNRTIKAVAKGPEKGAKAMEKLQHYDEYIKVLRRCLKPPPATSPRLVSWLLTALKFTQDCLTVKTVKSIPKKSALEAGLSRILLHTTKPTYKSWDKMKEMIAGLPQPLLFDYLEGAVGEMPLLGIGNVPEDEALMYAVGDADMTLRQALWMDEHRQELKYKWAVAPGDEDK